MKVALIASEAVPYAKTGGLADVTGTLFRKFRDLHKDASLFVPLYRKTMESCGSDIRDTGITIDIPLGDRAEQCRLFSAGGSGDKPGPVYLIGHEGFFGRDDIYGTPDGDYPDNAERFTFFCRAVLEVCRRLDLRFDIIHCSDWQTGLIPFYVKTLYRDDPVLGAAKTVFTIHNMGYQGIFPPSALGLTGLGTETFTPEGLEYYGKINLLKAGIVSATYLTTVSPTYAKEILTPAMGFGLDGVLRQRSGSLYGILNGIDYDEWNPSQDAYLPASFGPAGLAGKAACKKALMEQYGFAGTEQTPLCCFVGRISQQKGIDLLAGVIDMIVESRANCFILGKGDDMLQRLLAQHAAPYPSRVTLRIGFDESLAHLVYAGSDIFLMPSAYEPCGLGQMIAMRYGSIPVAHATGGLVDTITPPEDPGKFMDSSGDARTDVTGFLFRDNTKEAFAGSIRHALLAHERPNLWQRLVSNVMSRDSSWEKSARIYLDLYDGKLKP